MRSVAVLCLAVASIASFHYQAFADSSPGAPPEVSSQPLGPAGVAPAEKLTFAIEANWLYGPASGYVQVPAGGQPGTTSSNRPTFDEMGIKTVSIYDAQATMSLQRHEFYLGGEWIHMAGSGQVSEPMVSHGLAFPAGTDVSSTLTMDNYHAGYRYQWSLDGRPPRESTLSLYPSLGVAVLAVDYGLKGGGMDAKRNFMQANVEAGLEVEWKPMDRLSLLAGLVAAPPVSTLPGIIREQIVAKYLLVDQRSFILGVMAGVAFEQISWHDGQGVPNRVSADFGPMLLLGLKAEF